MALPKFKKKDEIPKGFEELYEEKEGEWIPKEDKTEETLAKVRGEKKDAETRAKAAEDKSADLQRQLDVEKAKGGDVDKKLSEALTKWNTDKDTAVKAVQDKLDAANADILKRDLDDKIGELFIKNGGREDRKAKAIKDTKERFGVVDGKLVMKDDKGQVTNAKPEDFFKADYRKESPEFYVATKATGGGGKGGVGTTPASSTDGDLVDKILKNPLATLQEANAAKA